MNTPTLLKISLMALVLAAPCAATQQKGLPPALPGAAVPAAPPAVPALDASAAVPGVPVGLAPAASVPAGGAGVPVAAVPAVPAAGLAEKTAALQAAVAKVPDLPAASPAQAQGAGVNLEAALTGEKLAAAATEVPVADVSRAAALAQAVTAAHGVVQKIRAEVAKVIVGQEPMVDAVLMALIAREHVLLEGVPGVAKTQTAKAMSAAVRGRFQRFQGTPDMMPSDILGSVILQEDPRSGKKDFVTRKGPVFTDIFLADEVNRMQPKTQSALLEAMGEKQVTIGGETHALSPAFSVWATQNPVEQDGTYRLPEAQLDRFMFKVLVTQPSLRELREIGRRNESAEAKPKAEPVTDLEELNQVRLIADQIQITDELEDYMARVAMAASVDPEIKAVVQYHVYTRAVIFLRKAARLNALLQGRAWVGRQDVLAVAPMVLRHRIGLNFNAKVSVEEVIQNILDKTPLKPFPAKAPVVKK